jgi:hypothetical protein
VKANGALFYVGDPHFAMADGEVALTAVEGSLRATFRLTVCKPGAGDAPSVAFRYPFAEDADIWVPIGLSDPDGSTGGQQNDLDVAMRRAVVNALPRVAGGRQDGRGARGHPQGALQRLTTDPPPVRADPGAVVRWSLGSEHGTNSAR